MFSTSPLLCWWPASLLGVQPQPNPQNVTKFACASASSSTRSLLCHPAQLAAAVLGQKCEAHMRVECRN